MMKEHQIPSFRAVGYCGAVWLTAIAALVAFPALASGTTTEILARGSVAALCLAGAAWLFRVALAYGSIASERAVVEEAVRRLRRAHTTV